LGNLESKKTLLAIFKKSIKSTLNMWFFNIIDINSKNVFILIIKSNNILKFDMLRHDLWLLYIFPNRDYKMYIWSCFHPHGVSLMIVWEHLEPVGNFEGTIGHVF
jgi:hypothetical protein